MSVPRVRLSEEDRFELMLSAAGRERRNRPLGLVIVAAIVLVGCAIFAVYAIGSRASSRGGLVRAQQDQAKLGAMIEQWKALSRTQSDSPLIGQPNAFKASKMEELATRAGMKTKPNTPRSIEDKTRTGIVVTRHIYTEVRDEHLKALVEWMRSGCAEIPGLELEAMTLKPEPSGWKLDATFRIWERAGT